MSVSKRSRDARDLVGRLRTRASLLQLGTPESEWPALAQEIVALTEQLSPEQFSANGTGPTDGGERLTDGAAFVLDAPETVPSLWGDGENVVWAAGEPLLIAGPQGVGKTTLAGRLALLRSGVNEGELLGMPVEVGAGRALYVAADRPRQIARSFRRMVCEAEREALSMALVVWKGPLPFDLGKAAPGQFVEFVEAFPEVDTVFVDALKDVASGLADDETGARVNAEFQRVIATGRELVIDHHQRKATSDNRRPAKLDDVYGSTWITSGCGSVLLLWGQPGDPIVELRHLKQPAGEIGPLNVIHDHSRGAVRVHEPIDLIDLVYESGGVTAPEAARRIYETANPSPSQVEKIRRRLNRAAGSGKITSESEGSGKTAEIVYRGVES